MIQPMAGSDGLHRQHILVVEPSLRQRLLYTWELEEAGHVVAAHACVAEAIRCSAGRCPDLLLVDAGLDTSELPGSMSALRAAFPGAAIILQTASYVCHSIGTANLADAFLHKSSDLDGLKRMVHALSSIPSAQAQLPVDIACLN